jgi:exopolysaccharide biosynthesis operon protein EpsL
VYEQKAITSQITKKYSQAFFFVSLPFISIVTCHAAPLDFRPYVSIGATADSNLFRLSGDEEAQAILGTTDLSDEYLVPAVGAESSWQYQRQEFDLDFEINRNQYNQYDELDYTGGFVKARWDWLYGRLWDGNVTYDFNKAQKRFENMLVPRRDIKTDNRIAFEADRKVDERRFVRLGGYYKDVDFSESTLNKKREASLKAGLFYKSYAENTAGAELQVIDASYPDRDVNIARLVDDGYMQTSFEAIADWVFSEKSKITARLGYTSREQNNISVNDFNGLTGRLDYIWDASEKTRIRTSIWQKPSTLGDEIANYAVVTGVGIQAGWDVTENTLIKAGVKYEYRDFKEDLDLVVDVPFESREDDVTDYWLSLVYDPQKHFSFELAYDNGKRDSNRELRDYDYDSITGYLKYTF